MEQYGVYIHIPFCKARCGYCAFSSCCDYNLQEKYFSKLFEEMEAYANREAIIRTVYIGGGTPSSVNIEYLDRLFLALKYNFDLTQVEEITVECNPESVNEALLDCLKRNGVNRLSFGLQSVNDETLARIGRIHRYDDFVKAVELARTKGFDNINADLILGLPESAEDFRRSVRVASRLKLAHISVYALELHDDSPIYNICKTKYNFSDDELADMYDYACEELARQRFDRYEISNFAQAGRECKHNLNYWREGRYFAFGAAASGFVDDARYTNPFDMRDYIATSVKSLRCDCEQITLAEQANEYVMLGLRLTSGISLAEFKQKYRNDFFEFFPNAKSLTERGFLAVEQNSVKVPVDKFYVVNSILCELLAF